MTAPNTDLILAARGLVKTWLTPAFAKAVDAGEFDPWGLMARAKEQLLKQPPIEEDDA